MTAHDSEYHHIAGYRVTCARGCFAPHWIPVARRESETWTDAGVGTRAGLESRRCKSCGDRVAIEAIWADAEGRVPPGSPEDVPGDRQG